MLTRRSKSVLEVTRLHVERGSTVILKEISWQVDPGQHWVILGPNGCGKTSLLKTLTAYLTPTSGEIRVFGKKFGETDWRELRTKIGIVTSALHSMIPGEEVALDTVISGKFAMLDLWGKISRSDRARSLRILADIGCVHLTERPWQFLSQGERQRILVARALMARPHLLILDEACAGLDPLAREHFLQFIDRLAHRPDAPALVFVTHHVEEITPAFSHVLMLRAGSVFAAGPKQKILTTENLGKTFNAHVQLKKNRGRYALSVKIRDKRAF